MPKRIRWQFLITAVVSCLALGPAVGFVQSDEAATGLKPARIYAEHIVRDGSRPQMGVLLEFWQAVGNKYPERKVRVYAKQGDGHQRFVSVVDAIGVIDVIGAYSSGDPDLDRRYSEVFQQVSQAQVLAAGTVPAEESQKSKVTLWRQLRSRASEFPRARKLARELVEHLNAKYPDVSARTYVREEGPYGVLELFIDYPARWHWEILDARQAEDARYTELTYELFSTVIEGSVHDEWWTRIL